MVEFRVVKEKHGWSIRMDDGVTSPFWSRDLAIRQANSLAAAIRRHGGDARVCIAAERASDPRGESGPATPPQPDAPSEGSQIGPR